MKSRLWGCGAASLSSSPPAGPTPAPTMTPSLTSTASRLETPQATTFLPSPPASTTSASQCAGIPQFTVMALGPFDVIAEFQLTPAGFLAWHDEFIRFNGVGVGHPGPGVSPWPFTTGGDQPVTVCYLRGRFAPHGSQAPDGPTFADEAVAVLEWQFRRAHRGRAEPATRDATPVDGNPVRLRPAPICRRGAIDPDRRTVVPDAITRLLADLSPEGPLFGTPGMRLASKRENALVPHLP